jgi:hypothetical protein
MAVVLPCPSLSISSVNGNPWCLPSLFKVVLVEIGPESGRRHNSPLIAPLPFEGKRPEASLGSGRREYRLATSLSILPFVYLFVATSTDRKQERK